MEDSRQTEGTGGPEVPLSPGGESLRLLVDAVTDYAIFLLDPGGRILTWNSGAERIKGYSADEIIGQHFSRFYPDDAIRSGWPQKELETAIHEGRIEDEGWRVRKDGSRFWANVVITALFDSAGHHIGFGKVTRDLTARKRAEEERIHLLAREEAAREEVRRKEDFLSVLAHQLRDPLAPILTSLHIARLPDADPKARDKALETAERRARLLVTVVDDLLESTRINRGEVELHLERLDLARLVRAAAENHRRAIELAGLTLTVSVPEVPVWVEGDSARLAQVLANLLHNALKYRDGGRKVAVRVEVDEGSHQAVVAVQDEGMGINAELLPQLFRPFTQSEQNLTQTRGGLGLGLAVVKGLVEMHGGTVSAASPGPGQGSTFTFRLPLEAEPAALTGATPESAEGRKALRVVIVEDNHDAAHSLRVLLELLGHRVSTVHTGPEGVRVAAEEHPDAVLSDIGLPGFDGFEVARRIRRQPGMEKALLVALTGYGDEESRRRSREAGFDFHFVKPADPEALLKVLASRGTGGGEGRAACFV